MKIGYARVSTLAQDLKVQIQALENEKCDEIYKEKFTGTKKNRPVFQEVLGKLQSGNTLVVTKLDRLARNTKEGIEVIEELFERGVKVHVLNVGLLENTTMGRFFLTTMLAVAEMEHSLIVERTSEGKALARLKEGYSEGAPKKYSRAAIFHALDLLKTHSYDQVKERTGISKSTLIRAKKKYQK